MKIRTRRLSYVLALMLLVVTLLGAGKLFLQIDYASSLRTSYGITEEQRHYAETSWAAVVTPSRWIHLAGPTNFKGAHGHFLTRHGLIYYSYCLFHDMNVIETEDGNLMSLAFRDEHTITIVDREYRYYVATSMDGKPVGVKVPAQHEMVRPLTLYSSRALIHYIDDIPEILSRTDFNSEFMSLRRSIRPSY